MAAENCTTPPRSSSTTSSGTEQVSTVAPVPQTMPGRAAPVRVSRVSVIVRLPSTAVLLAIGTGTVWLRTPGANVSVRGTPVVLGVKFTVSVPTGLPSRCTVMVAEPAASETE